MTNFQIFLLIVYIAGVIVMMGLHFLASMLQTMDSPGYHPLRVFITVFLWPAFIAALIIAKIVFKIRNPYAEDE